VPSSRTALFIGIPAIVKYNFFKHDTFYFYREELVKGVFRNIIFLHNTYYFNFSFGKEKKVFTKK